MSDKSSVITSSTNPTVKYIRSLHRRRVRYREQAFIAEGLRTIQEALKAGIQPAFLFQTPSMLEQTHARLVTAEAEKRGVSITTVSESVMAVMSDTVTPSGMLGVFAIPAPSIPRPADWVLVLDGLRDPGNTGTILRSALAAGVELVITAHGTVDVYSPKVVRAGMGAHFQLNLCLNQAWPQITPLLEGLRVLLAEPRGGIPYWQLDWQQPTALVIGGEARGVSSEAQQLVSEAVTIPMMEDSESLNAAIAASVLLFEAARQRLFSPDERVS